MQPLFIFSSFRTFQHCLFRNGEVRAKPMITASATGQRKDFLVLWLTSHGLRHHATLECIDYLEKASGVGWWWFFSGNSSPTCLPNHRHCVKWQRGVQTASWRLWAILLRSTHVSWKHWKLSGSPREAFDQATNHSAKGMLSQSISISTLEHATNSSLSSLKNPCCPRPTRRCW